MFFYEGQSCPVCNRPFTEKDDIVSCPVCGAPHHRACWQAEGHCHFEDAHGTDRQWSRKASEQQSAHTDGTENRCPNCGAINVEHAEFCSRCGRTLHAQEWSSAPQYGQRAPYHEYTPFRVAFDPLGGISRDEQFDDNVSAEDLAICVGGNTAYYLPRFHKMKEGRSIQWSWVAFLIAPYWLLYRKQYLAGILVSLFYFLFDLLVNVIFYMSGALEGSMLSYTEAIELTQQAGYFPALFLLSIGMIVCSLLFGLFGNRLYMHSCIKKVKQIKEQDPVDYRNTLRHAGGVSFIWGAVAYFSISLLSTLINTFILL